MIISFNLKLLVNFLIMDANVFYLKSNIIKGKIQHDKTFAAAAATAINFKKNNLNLIRATLPN